MRVLVLGAAGMLGRDLMATTPSGIETLGIDRDEADLRDDDAVARVLDSFRPRAVINASGYTAVDRAETERDEAFSINATAVGALGAACARRSIRVLHYSTDYVFPGTEDRAYREEDAVAPVNAYGESKLAGEQALLATSANALVVRTQWLFGIHGKSFPRTMWDRATLRQPTKVVTDQRGRPTYSMDLATVSWRLVSSAATGILHVANAGAASWFDLAARVFAAGGASELLSPCLTADYPTPARRPRNSVLNTSKLESLVATKMPSWEDALDRFLRELAPSGALPR